MKVMFGFLYKGQVNDDAVVLNNLVNKAVQDYASLPPKEIREAVNRDFVDPHKLVTDHQVFFTYSELPEFDIGFSSPRENNEVQELNVIGKGRYSGFQLQAFGDGNRQCWAIGGTTIQVTGPAKLLAKTMQKKYGVYDASRDMRSLTQR